MPTFKIHFADPYTLPPIEIEAENFRYDDKDRTYNFYKDIAGSGSDAPDLVVAAHAVLYIQQVPDRPENENVRWVNLYKTGRYPYVQSGPTAYTSKQEAIEGAKTGYGEFSDNYFDTVSFSLGDSK